MSNIKVGGEETALYRYVNFVQGEKLSWCWPRPLDCNGRTSLGTASLNRFHGQQDGAQWRRWPPIEHCTGRRKDKELFSGRQRDGRGGGAEDGSQAALLRGTTSSISSRPPHTRTTEELHQRHDAPLTVETYRRLRNKHCSWWTSAPTSPGLWI